MTNILVSKPGQTSVLVSSMTNIGELIYRFDGQISPKLTSLEIDTSNELGCSFNKQYS